MVSQVQIPVEVIAPEVKTAPLSLKKHPAYVVYVEQAPIAMHPVVPLVVHFLLAI